MNKFVSKQGKQLLRNTIQSTTSQNKILEQNLMWKANEKKNTSILHEKGVKRKRTGSFEEDKGVDGQSSGNYWMKKLIKEEEKHPERWGHHGYKELYPKDFESDKESSCSSNESNESEECKKKKEKKKRKKKLKKEKKKAKKHKKHRRK